jgi:hypothetical protein
MFCSWSRITSWVMQMQFGHLGGIKGCKKHKPWGNGTLKVRPECVAHTQRREFWWEVDCMSRSLLATGG